MRPQTSEWQSLAERVKKLENQNHRLKQMGAFVLVLTAAVLLMGQASRNRTVEANEFILKDASGKMRARLGMEADGPLFSLFAQDGHARAKLFVAGDTTMLSLADGNEHPRALLGVLSEGPLLNLADGTGKPQATLSALREEPALDIYDGNGKERVGMGIEGNVPKVVVQDADRKAVAQLSETSEGASFAIKDDKGYLTLIGTTDLITPRTGETHKTSAASVVLFDKDKKVLWQAP